MIDSVEKQQEKSSRSAIEVDFPELAWGRGCPPLEKPVPTNRCHEMFSIDTLSAPLLPR